MALIQLQKQEGGFVFQFIGLLHSGSKGRYFNSNKKTQFCVQTLAILMESIDHRTGSILTVISQPFKSFKP